jgi:hypothetical protein
MFGFLYRASVGAATEFFRGRSSLKNLCQNLGAACRLPFVYLGVTRDPWRDFTRYLQIESGLGATYYAITQKGYAGRNENGTASRRRAAGYALQDIKPELERIQAQGAEVALHGLDAWMDSASGQAEQETLSQTLGNRTTNGGVRMHWLLFDQNSPKILDQAGFSYDSTVGYNETVGFRAGTAQAYQPSGVSRLLELPLHVMDTALFYPSHLNLSEAEAERLVGRILDEVSRFGGVLTINWHDRSISPERLWGDFYRKLLNDLKRRKAWFPTAAQAVSWFRKRRLVKFGSVQWGEGQVQFSVTGGPDLETPGLRVRVHPPSPRNLFDEKPATSATAHLDLAFQTNLAVSVALPV